MPTTRSIFEPAAATQSTFELTAEAEDHRIARLAAAAVALSAVEAAFPSPLPGVKPGIANIVVLLVLHQYGWRTALWISLLRVVVSSLLLGSFLSPGFVLSFTGACCSLAALGVARLLPRAWFGPVTQSVLAALAHMAGQVALAYLWLIPHAGLAYFIPFLAAAALVFGAINGVICAKLLRAHDDSALAPAALRTA
jgi:heptaprenyl diphosphate synthase